MTTLAMYIQGDIYPGGGNDPAAVVKAVTTSRLTTPILALCHVNCSAATCPNSSSPPGSHDADLTFNDTLIVRDGTYVGDPSWPATVRSLRAGNVSEIFASFGGYGVPDFSRIGTLIRKYGTGPTSPLFRNFACLKQTLGIDGIDLDDEDTYDVTTVVEFSKMLLSLGFEVTFCPYTEQEFWTACVAALGGRVAWINLQCYAGGKDNDPSDWAKLGAPLVAGVCADCCCPSTQCNFEQVQQVFTLWTTGSGAVSSDCWSGSSGAAVELAGGFIWTYADVKTELDAYVDAMAAGLG